MDGLCIALAQPAKLGSGHISTRVHEERGLSSALQRKFSEFENLALYHEFDKFLLVLFHTFLLLSLPQNPLLFGRFNLFFILLFIVLMHRCFVLLI